MKAFKSLILLFVVFFPTFLLAQKNRVLIKEASFRYEYKEFELKKDTLRFLKKYGTTGQYPDSQLETVTETVLIEPARIKCEITEPVYKTIVITKKVSGKKITYEKQVLIKKATIKKIEIPAKYGTITKTVLCCPDGGAGTGARPIRPIEPDEYGTIEILKFKQKTTVKRIKIPAEYKIIE